MDGMESVQVTSQRRVGVDGLFLSQPHTGSGQYALHLWRHLAADAGADPEAVLLQPEGIAGLEPGAVQVAPPVWARSPRARKLWWEQRGLVRAARRAGVGLIHVPYFSAPRLSPVPTVVTIHDVIPLIFPEYGGAPAMRAYLRLVAAAARRAAAIVTDSECSRRDIETYLGIPASRIAIIPLAADERYGPVDDPAALEALRGRFDLRGPVIFNVGGLDVRKNLAALIEAFARALPQLPPETRLVIGGRAHSGNARLYPPLEPLIRSRGLEGKVVLTGPLTEEEKLLLYNLADVYVFPSLYEGFGLSPLEAMACGTPVICSDRSSLPEVVGRGGLLIEPSPTRLASAIVSVLSDEQLRRDLSRAALEQAATFSWRRTAALTREVYVEVLGRAAREPVAGRVG